jgi:hypothetical protein
MKIEINQKVLHFRGMIKIIPRQSKITKGSKNIGRFVLVRILRPMRIPMMVAHSAGISGRENIGNCLGLGLLCCYSVLYTF